jgi:Skp family chaperone for outer membrane proteins
MFKNLFTNWRKVAEKAAARADALESEKRAVEHKNDHLRTERVMLRDQLDRVKMERDDRAEERDEWRDDYERQRDRG